MKTELSIHFIDLLKITQTAVEILRNQPVLVATYCSSISIDSCRYTIRNDTNSIEGMLPASAVFFWDRAARVGTRVISTVARPSLVVPVICVNAPAGRNMMRNDDVGDVAPASASPSNAARGRHIHHDQNCCSYCWIIFCDSSSSINKNNHSESRWRSMGIARWWTNEMEMDKVWSVTTTMMMPKTTMIVVIVHLIDSPQFPTPAIALSTLRR